MVLKRGNGWFYVVKSRQRLLLSCSHVDVIDLTKTGRARFRPHMTRRDGSLVSLALRDASNDDVSVCLDRDLKKDTVAIHMVKMKGSMKSQWGTRCCLSQQAEMADGRHSSSDVLI